MDRTPHWSDGLGCIYGRDMYNSQGMGMGYGVGRGLAWRYALLVTIEIEQRPEHHPNNVKENKNECRKFETMQRSV